MKDWREFPKPHWFFDLARDIRVAIDHNSKNHSSVYEGMLESSVGNMYAAREAYKSEADRAMTVLIAVMTLGTIAAGYGVNNSGNQRAAYLFISSVVLIVFPVMIYHLYKGKLTAGYNLYISACIHSALLHVAMQMPHSHSWHRHAVDYLDRWGDFPTANRTRFGSSSTNAASLKDEELRTPFNQHFDPFPAAIGVNRIAPDIEALVAVWREIKGNLLKLQLRTMKWAIIVSVISGAVCLAFALYALHF